MKQDTAADRDRGEKRGPTTYLAPGVDAAAVARFFRASASLYRAAPWRFVTADSRGLVVTIEALGLHRAPLHLMAGDDAPSGFILFPDDAAKEAFIAVGEEVLAGGDARDVPAHSALEMVPAEELEPTCVAEIAAHGWEVAAPDAHPEAVIVNDAGLRHHPTLQELVVLEAVALAAAALGRSKEASQALRDGEAVDGTFVVELARGRVSAVVQTQALLAGDGASDDDLRSDGLSAADLQLLASFVASPEAVAAGVDGRWARCLLEHAGLTRGASAATLSPEIVDEVVFHTIPRHVSCQPTAAAEIIREVPAFLRHLSRAGLLTSVDDYLALFPVTAEADLEAALGDASLFGPAKQFFMAGTDAGHDMSTPEGVRAWLAQTSGRPAATRGSAHGSASPTPASPVTTAEQRRAQRNKRKATQARRRRSH